MRTNNVFPAKCFELILIITYIIINYALQKYMMYESSLNTNQLVVSLSESFEFGD